MYYKEVAEALSRAEEVSGKNEIITIIGSMLKMVPKNEIRKVIYLLKGTLDAEYKAKPLGIAENVVIKALSMLSVLSEKEIEQMYHSAGDLGTVAEMIISRKKVQKALFSEDLTVEKVYQNFRMISEASGKSSQSLKIRYLMDLLNSSTPVESKYLMRMAVGKLRIGIAEMVLLGAIAYAFSDNGDPEIIERAFNLSADLGTVAEVLNTSGIEGLRKIGPEPGIPVRVMLAERAESFADLVSHLPFPNLVEYKYDGLRMQAHLDNGKVTLFSRSPEDITGQYPEIVDALRSRFSNARMILDGELVAVGVNGKHLPFQEISRRRGRKYDIEKASAAIQVNYFVFDLLYYEKSLIDMPALERREILSRLVNGSGKIRHAKGIIANDEEAMETIFNEALEDGCEGIIAKSIEKDSFYMAGKRGWTWIKFKKDYRSDLMDTLDLVVLAAFYGHGKRSNLYGAFLMGCYNSNTNIYETVCKVGTGFSDNDLLFFKELLDKLKSERQKNVKSRIEADVWFAPSVVMEISGAEITMSPSHTCAYGIAGSDTGLALRFPRYTGIYRSDRKGEDCTSTSEIVEIYNGQNKKVQRAEGEI